MEVALDTNALSAFADGDEGLAAALMPFRSLALPVIVLGEYRYGLRGSRKRQRLEEWLKEFLDDVRVLEVTTTTSAVYAEVRHQLRAAGTPIPENDVWIAALAVENRLPLMTRDKHFDSVYELEVLRF